MENLSEELKKIAENQDTRTLSDAELIKKGARHIAIDEKGNTILRLTLEQENFLKENEGILKDLEKNGSVLKNLSKELRANKDIVLAAVKNDGYALQFASPELRDEKEIVLTAVKQNNNAINFASQRLILDEEIQKAAGIIRKK